MEHIEAGGLDMKHDACTGANSGRVATSSLNDSSKSKLIGPAFCHFPPHHRIEVVDGDPLPTALGRLRYDKYVREQSKPYSDADHASELLCDEVDALSIHILNWSENGSLGAALRLTPMVVTFPRD